MARLGRVEPAQGRLLCLVQSNARRAMVCRLLLGAAAHETSVNDCDRVRAGGRATRGWAHTVSLVLISTAKDRLTTGSEHPLEQRPAIFLPSRLSLLFERHGAVLGAKAFVYVVRGRADPSGVL